MHEVRPVGLENNQIIVSVVFSNLSVQLVKELDFSVSDSSSIKLMKTVSKVFYSDILLSSPSFRHTSFNQLLLIYVMLIFVYRILIIMV